MTSREMFGLLRRDLTAMRVHTGGVRHTIWPNFGAVIMFRVGQWCRDGALKPFAWLLFALNQTLTGAELPPSAEIGGGFYLVHSCGVVISAGAIAGENLTLFGGTVIGSAPAVPSRISAKVGYPRLGDNVTMFTKASVIGPVEVGSGVVVGAHAVVTADVPAEAIVGGIPARVIG
jgi:serine O-acetyltransferase